MCSALRCSTPRAVAPSTKIARCLRHLLGLLLAHRAAQQVGAAERVAGQHLRDLHHLLLVQDHAVGRLQDRLQVGMQVVDRPAGRAVLARDEVVDHAGLQRARAGTAPPARRCRRSGRAAGAGSGPSCRATRAGTPRWSRQRLQQLVGRARRPSAARRCRAAARRSRARCALMSLHGPVDDRQRAQAEEVELHQARPPRRRPCRTA